MRVEFFTEKSTKQLLSSAQFLKLQKNPVENGYADFNPVAVSYAPDFNWLNKSKTTKLVVPEGCGTYPIEWMRSGKIVATIKKPVDRHSYYIQIPAGFKESKLELDFEKSFRLFISDPKTDSDNSAQIKYAACLKTAKAFSKDNKSIVYLTCSDDLGYMLYIFNKDSKQGWPKKESAALTLTDDCP